MKLKYSFASLYCPQPPRASDSNTQLAAHAPDRATDAYTPSLYALGARATPTASTGLGYISSSRQNTKAAHLPSPTYKLSGWSAPKLPLPIPHPPFMSARGYGFLRNIMFILLPLRLWRTPGRVPGMLSEGDEDTLPSRRQ